MKDRKPRLTRSITFKLGLEDTHEKGAHTPWRQKEKASLERLRVASVTIIVIMLLTVIVTAIKLLV